MKFSQGKSILFYAAVSIVPVLVVLVLAATFALASIRYRSEVEARSQFATEITQIYFGSLEDAIWDFRMSDMEAILQGLYAMPSVSEVKLTANEKTIFLFGERGSEDEVHKVGFSARKVDGKAQWFLEISSDKHKFSNLLWSYLKQSLVYIVLILGAMGVILFTFFERYLLMPTKNLRQALVDSADHLALRKIATTQMPKEFAALATGYNNLVHRIKIDQCSQEKLNKQSQHHFKTIQAISERVAAGNLLLEDLLEICFAGLSEEVEVGDVGLMFLDNRNQTLMKCKNGDIAKDWCELKTGGQMLTYIRSLPKKFGILKQDTRRSQFFYVIEIDGVKSGIAVLESRSEYETVRDSSALFLYSICSLVGLIIEAIYREKKERIQRLADDRDKRMREIGQLGSGLSHDFNNHLQTIMGNVELALDSVHKTSSTAKYLETSLRQIDLARRMTQQILDYLKNTASGEDVFDCYVAVEEQLKSLSANHNEEFSFEINKTGECVAMVDSVAFARAVQNIVTNSIYQAENKKAHIVVTILQVEDSDNLQLDIIFEDNCGGFSDVALAHAKEPFFTTKPQGDGTGLGLSMVQDFATNVGGALMLENSEQGARVTLRLPATSVRLVEATKSLSQSFDLPMGKTIGLIEDAFENAKVLQKILERNHNHVSHFECAQSFRKLSKRKLLEFDILISDVNLPDGFGPDLVAEAERKVSRKIPCLFVSGDDSQSVASKHESHQGFLSKPFSVAEFINKIGEISCWSEAAAQHNHPKLMVSQ